MPDQRIHASSTLSPNPSSFPTPCAAAILEVADLLIVLVSLFPVVLVPVVAIQQPQSSP